MEISDLESGFNAIAPGDFHTESSLEGGREESVTENSLGLCTFTQEPNYDCDRATSRNDDNGPNLMTFLWRQSLAILMPSNEMEENIFDNIQNAHTNQTNQEQEDNDSTDSANMTSAAVMLFNENEDNIDTIQNSHDQTNQEQEDNDSRGSGALCTPSNNPNFMNFLWKQTHAFLITPNKNEENIFDDIQNVHEQPNQEQEDNDSTGSENMTLFNGNEENIDNIQNAHDQPNQEQENHGSTDSENMDMCGICLENRVRSHGDINETFCCNGTVRHYFHMDCFLAYARLAFKHDGVYCRRVQQQQQSNDNEEGILVSNTRELPCPFFESGNCDCACIPDETLIGFFLQNDDILRAFFKAKIRSWEQEQELPQQQEESAIDPDNTALAAMNRLLNIIDEVLARACSVSCPQCGSRIQKDDACMHMTCSRCNTRFCYCCGRVRGPSSCGHRKCDTWSSFIESQPGWNNLSTRTSESSAMGALHEFHRRRMAYFLNQVKQLHPQELWAELRRENPNKFADVPTTGRRITWLEIDNTTDPPIFGTTTADDLTWRWDGRSIAVSMGTVGDVRGNAVLSTDTNNNNSANAQSNVLMRIVWAGFLFAGVLLVLLCVTSFFK